MIRVTRRKIIMNKRHFAFIALTLIVFALLTGCGSTAGHSLTVCSCGYNITTKKSPSYQKFGGTKEYTFQVNDGQKLAMDVSFVTEAGPLNVWIAKDGERKNAVYEGNNIQMSSFTVTVHEQGKYITHLDADNHCGSYLSTRK